jgi:hypothetical protein
LKGVDGPIGFCERTWCVHHIFRTCWRQRAAGRIRPYILLPGPLSAEGKIKYEVHVDEMIIDRRTAVAREQRRRSSPSRRVWIGRVGISRYCTAREEPDFDKIRSPLCGVDAALVVVETAAESDV